MGSGAKPEPCEREGKVDTAYRDPERPVRSDG